MSIYAEYKGERLGECTSDYFGDDSRRYICLLDSKGFPDSEIQVKAIVHNLSTGDTIYRVYNKY